MPIALIAACTPERVIGKNNRLPWHMPADLCYFRKTTRGKTVVMGRRTFDSIGRALPGRQNIVITRNKNFHAPNIEVFHGLPQALETCQKNISHSPEKEVFIIGGEEIFRETLPLAEKIYLTFIYAKLEGDTYFPEWRPKEWQEIFHQDHLADKENLFDYSFVVLKRLSQ